MTQREREILESTVRALSEQVAEINARSSVAHSPWAPKPHAAGPGRRPAVRASTPRAHRRNGVRNGRVRGAGTGGANRETSGSCPKFAMNSPLHGWSQWHLSRGATTA